MFDFNVDFESSPDFITRIPDPTLRFCKIEPIHTRLHDHAVAAEFVLFDWKLLSAVSTSQWAWSAAVNKWPPGYSCAQRSLALLQVNSSSNSFQPSGPMSTAPDKKERNRTRECSTHAELQQRLTKFETLESKNVSHRTVRMYHIGHLRQESAACLTGFFLRKSDDKV